MFAKTGKKQLFRNLSQRVPFGSIPGQTFFLLNETGLSKTSETAHIIKYANNSNIYDSVKKNGKNVSSLRTDVC